MLTYCPEGLVTSPPSSDALRRGTGTGEIFQAMCIKCDEFHNLHLDLGTMRGIIPREEAALGIAEGVTREIAIMSRVGKAVSFQVLAFDSRGTAILSRRAAQAEAKKYYLTTLQPGDILLTTVQNPANFGVFCDIGCGFPALMRIDRCCISRLRSTSELYHTGQMIYAAVLTVDPATGQILLTGRELLGTWLENASLFRQGQTVTGTIRSIMPYGCFVELAPNLSGLAETELDIHVGDTVSVYIRSILPEKHKIKLSILEKLTNKQTISKPHFFLPQGRIQQWEYYPGSKAVTIF